MIDFEWLKNYFESNEQVFKQKEINFSGLLGQETDKPSEFVDVFGETLSARVILWETGECDFEIIDSDKTNLSFGKIELSKHLMN